MESDSKSDNIILGPWNGSGKKPPKKNLSIKEHYAKIETKQQHLQRRQEICWANFNNRE